MTLQYSGPITLTDIQAEFGVLIQLAWGEYYKGAGIVTATAGTTNIPSSGAISLSNFYGAYLVTAGSQSFTSSGNFVVPAGISILTVTITGSRGGAGGNFYAIGDESSGSRVGGSGGFGAQVYQASLAVTAGETLTITVGGGGARGSDSTIYGNSTSGSAQAGFAGGASTVKRGATTLLSANGGGGGGGASGALSSGGNPISMASGSGGAGSSVGSGGTITGGANGITGGNGGAGTSGSCNISWVP